MFDSDRVSDSAASAVLVDQICGAARAENQAAGARLTAIGALDALRAREATADEYWSADTFTAVAAEVAAALTVSQGLASSFVAYARALRDRLPKVGGLLTSGQISYWTVQTIVFRTELSTDPDIIAAVDATLASKVARWSSLTRGRLGGFVDKIVARADADAVRQRRERHADRGVGIWHTSDGVSHLFGWLISTDAHVLDARLDALAATVCAEDPRTAGQRRADAMGALAAGAQRLACRCGRADCPAAGRPVPASVLIHVIAEQATLDGTGTAPGTLIDDDALIPAELLAEMAAGAKQRPLRHLADTPPESGYVPSQSLANFVRCRDLTCRFPGCDKPAIDCDLDHTIPHSRGGPTHASKVRSFCRFGCVRSAKRLVKALSRTWGVVRDM